MHEQMPLLAKPPTERSSGHGIRRVRDEADQTEHAAEHKDLRPGGATVRTNELRKEREEEQRHLRIGELDEEPPADEPALALDALVRQRSDARRASNRPDA